ncbi:hypothetical protein V2G26_003329 [Clonostachys chloroleuca]
MPPKRMTANPVRPARHRPGKPAGDDSSSSDLDNEGSGEEEHQQAAVPPPPKAASAGRIVSNLGKVDLNARKKEAEVNEQKRIAAERAERLAAEEGFVTEEEGESSEGEDDDDEEGSGSSEEEESSEEEAPRRLMMRPKFIPKNQRGKANEQEKEEAARLAEEEARRKAADQLVEDQIKRDLEARAAGKKHWDDENNEESDVDTTDGLDPEAEEAAWRVRELKRLKRARTAIEEREAELAEVERRKNLTEEERQAEDEAHIARQKEEKEGKGKMSYMQRYFHKGAFFQEESEAAGLLQRDIMGSRIQDDVRNREALPEFLQRRDMTKLGKKGATRYKDMRTEDTGRWGQFDDGRRRGGEGRFGGDDRFQPDDDRFRPDDDRGAKGANAIPLGDRKERRDDRRDDRRDRHSYHSRDRSRDDERRRARSRSRSPRRDRDRDRDREDHRTRRKRSTSREGDRYDSDKRRRVDSR